MRSHTTSHSVLANKITDPAFINSHLHLNYGSSNTNANNQNILSFPSPSLKSGNIFDTQRDNKNGEVLVQYNIFGNNKANNNGNGDHSNIGINKNMGTQPNLFGFNPSPLKSGNATNNEKLADPMNSFNY